MNKLENNNFNQNNNNKKYKNTTNNKTTMAGCDTIEINLVVLIIIIVNFTAVSLLVTDHI